jgi:hypothetical protein
MIDFLHMTPEVYSRSDAFYRRQEQSIPEGPRTYMTTTKNRHESE